MGETQEKQHHISFEEEANKGADYMANSSNITISQSLTSWRAKYKRWLEIGFHSLLVLICLAAATLLGELYYKEGGKSTWMNSLVQTVGFPVLFPFLFLKKREETQDDDNNARNNKNPSVWMFLSVYVFLGLLLGGICMLNAVGLLHLPVSTFSLIAASQLGFNALFSFFLNSQKITTYIANSIILLTISSILLVFQPIDSSSANGESSKGKSYTIGFICTLFGSAGMALLLSSTERIFRKIMKKRTMKEVMNVVIWQSFFATCAILIGLFASGEWKWMKSEMQEYKLGKVSYVMTLVWTALCWQIYTIGLLSLIMKVSALFANVITTLSVPLIPVLAVIIFGEKMSGVKAVSMILALWGFLSYGYQQYLDELKLKAEKSAEKEESEVSLVERGLSGGT